MDRQIDRRTYRRQDQAVSDPGVSDTGVRRGRGYHHGDLPAALLAAVDEIVRHGDAGAVSLRQAARRAGVSHAAPAHHFGDKAGLLTAYAAQGFVALRERLSAAGAQASAAQQSVLLGMGVAYVRFAVEQPGHFAVMFRPELLDVDRPGFRATCDDAFQVLVDAVRASWRADDPDESEILLAATGAWSIVHGFATLWLEGTLPEEVTRQDPGQAAAGALLAFAGTVRGLDLAGLARPPSADSGQAHP